MSITEIKQFEITGPGHDSLKFVVELDNEGDQIVRVEDELYARELPFSPEDLIGLATWIEANVCE